MLHGFSLNYLTVFKQMLNSSFIRVGNTWNHLTAWKNELSSVSECYNVEDISDVHVYTGLGIK